MYVKIPTSQCLDQCSQYGKSIHITYYQPWLSCLPVCRRRKRGCAHLFLSRSLFGWYQKGHVPFFLPRHSCMQERLVPFPLVLHASSLQCMRFQLFQVLDYRLSFIESKLRNVFLSTPCKRGAKQTTISNLRNMYLWK